MRLGNEIELIFMGFWMIGNSFNFYGIRADFGGFVWLTNWKIGRIEGMLNLKIGLLKFIV